MPSRTGHGECEAFQEFQEFQEEVSWPSGTSKFFPYYETINMFEFSAIYFSPVTWNIFIIVAPFLFQIYRNYQRLHALRAKYTQIGTEVRFISNRISRFFNGSSLQLPSRALFHESLRHKPLFTDLEENNCLFLVYRLEIFPGDWAVWLNRKQWRTNKQCLWSTTLTSKPGDTFSEHNTVNSSNRRQGG